MSGATRRGADLFLDSKQSRTRRAAAHLRAASNAMLHARSAALKVDEAEGAGGRLLAWSHVFSVVAEASREVDALKLLIAEEMHELLHRGEADLTAEDRRAIEEGIRQIHDQLGR